MCYDDKAQPPIPHGEPGSARGKDIVLTSADGTRFAAYIAQSTKPTDAQIVIYPDVRGLHNFYKELAQRFAEHGVDAIAIDYFGRTAGLTSRDEPFEFWPHVQQMQLPNVVADARAAMEYINGTHSVPQKATFIVGFCMGGSLTIYSATEPLGLAGVIPFYAGLSRQLGGASTTVLDSATQVKYPLLGLFGGADQGIPVSEVQQLDEKLDQTGTEHEIVIYPGAPHSFFDRRFNEFANESADAWKRIQGFIATHSGQKSA